MRAWDVPQVVGFLPDQVYQSLVLIHSNMENRVVVCACNSRILEVDAEGSEVQDHLLLHRS